MHHIATEWLVDVFDKKYKGNVDRTGVVCLSYLNTLSTCLRIRRIKYVTDERISRVIDQSLLNRIACQLVITWKINHEHNEGVSLSTRSCSESMKLEHIINFLNILSHHREKLSEYLCLFKL